MRLDAVVESVKLSAAAASVPVSTYMIPAWGTTPYTFVLAGIGSVMSYGWDPKREPNAMSLVIKSTIVMFFSVALVVVLPDVANWDIKSTTQPPLAFILALYGRRIMSALKDGIPAMGRGIAGMLSSRNGGGYGGDYGGDYNQPPMADPRESDQKDIQPDDKGY